MDISNKYGYCYLSVPLGLDSFTKWPTFMIVFTYTRRRSGFLLCMLSKMTQYPIVGSKNMCEWM
jgi:hypothetical protein